MTPYIRVTLSDNLSSHYDRMWKDYRRYPSSSQTWTVSVQWVPSDYTSPTTITIRWNLSDITQSEYSQVYFTTDSGDLVMNMLQGTSYIFSCPANIPQRFMIICKNMTSTLKTPNAPSGITIGYHGTSYTYSTFTIDLDSNEHYYRFDWGDNTMSVWLGPYKTSEQCLASHVWKIPGIYNIKTQAKDTYGNESNWSQEISVEITNRKPTQPDIQGPLLGTKNTSYVYSFISTDADNDFLQYYITWGDGTQNTSDFLSNGTMYSFMHSWKMPGKYRIIVKATDNTTFSEQKTIDVFIDVSFINTIGFLYDADINGQVDSFYSNDTGIITSVQRTDDRSYYLDTDDDGIWNYLYNPSTGSLTLLGYGVTTIENQWFFILIIAVAVIIIAFIVYLYKKNYF